MSSPSLKIITALFDERFFLHSSADFHDVRFRSQFFILFSFGIRQQARNSGPISNDDANDADDDDILST